MNNAPKIVNEAIATGGKHFVRTATNRLLGEDITSGTKVAVIDDTITGMSGAKGIVRKISDANPGFADVELENGTTMPMQTSLLIPVG